MNRPARLYRRALNFGYELRLDRKSDKSWDENLTIRTRISPQMSEYIYRVYLSLWLHRYHSILSVRAPHHTCAFRSVSFANRSFCSRDCVPSRSCKSSTVLT